MSPVDVAVAIGAICAGIGSLAGWRKINAVNRAVNDVAPGSMTLRALVERLDERSATQGTQLATLHAQFDEHIQLHLKGQK